MVLARWHESRRGRDGGKLSTVCRSAYGFELPVSWRLGGWLVRRRRRFFSRLARGGRIAIVAVEVRRLLRGKLRIERRTGDFGTEDVISAPIGLRMYPKRGHFA